MNEKIKQMFLMRRSHAEICNTIAKYLLKKYKFLSIDSKARVNEIFVYDDGIYTDTGRVIIKQECEQIIEGFIKTNMVNEIMNKIERQTYVNREVLSQTPLHLICVENGILNIKTKELKPHSPKFIFLNKLPIVYNQNSFCHKFLNFLEQTLYHEDILTCQEWFGFLLWRRYFEKKALVCIGPTDTGKTVFLSTVINFLGQKNISTVDLHHISKDKFATEWLYNKYANINDEMTSDDLKDVSQFKKLTGRSKLTAEPKFMDKFSFESYAKLIFATNKMPILYKSIEDQESYYNRWIVFLFDNKIEEKDKDKGLIEIFKTKRELSGILNWALEGLDRLIKNKEFTLTKSWEEVEKIMKSNGESVFSFMVKGIEVDVGFVNNELLYEKYVEFCKLNDKIIENQISFGRKFKPNFGKRVNDGTKNGWKGIKIKSVLLDI